MSLVGPRPELSRFVAGYPPKYKRILDVRPGLTSPAAIIFRNEADLLEKTPDIEAAYIARILPQKLEFNLDYVQQQGFLYDLSLIFTTFYYLILNPKTKRKAGNYAPGTLKHSGLSSMPYKGQGNP